MPKQSIFMIRNGLNDGTESNNTWVISAYGAVDSGTGFSLPALHWGFQNGDKAGDVSSFVDTGVSLATGTVYHFVVTVNPATSTYSASISNGTGSPFLSGVLDFRTANAFTSSTPTYINFTDRHSASATTTSWSLDSLNITGELADVTPLLASGFNNGNWSGAGIDSMAAQNDTTHLTALGVVLNGSPAGSIYSTFDGQSVFQTDVLIKFTYFGDANLDGMVTGNASNPLPGSDYYQLANGNSLGLNGWQNGDFNYNGRIDGSDYTLIDNGFNRQGPQL